MARFVRCIEGHVFDGEVGSVCPICGARVGADSGGSEAAPAPRGSGSAADDPARLARRGFFSSRRGQVATSIAVMVAAAALMQFWTHRPKPSVERPPDAVVARPTPPVVNPPIVSPPRVLPPSDPPWNTRPNPPPVVEPPSVSVWSSFQQIAKPTPETMNVALPTLPEAQRTAINAGFAMLQQWLRDDATNANFPPGDGDRFGTNPDGSALVPSRALLRAAIDSVARQGRWSDEAVATAEFLRARGKLRQGSNSDAVDAMENAMRLGSPSALRFLGNFRSLGRKPDEGNPVVAAHYYKICADRGQAICALHYAGLLRTGKGVAKDTTETKRYFLLALELGVGAGVGEPNEVAERARRGQADAIRQLAPYGVAVRDLPIQTADLYRDRAERGLAETVLELLARAQRGDSAAMFGIALMSRDKEALSLPDPAHLALLREAAKRGRLEAMNHLGGRLLDGPPELLNPGEAILWFFAAATDWSNAKPPGRQPAEGYKEALSRLSTDQRAVLEPFFTALTKALNEVTPPPQRR